MVAALSGPADLVERPDAHLTPAPVVHDVPAPRDGWIAGIDTRALGLAVVALGGGRTHPDQHVDPRVGLDRIRRIGEAVEAGEPLARVHAADAAAASRAAAAVREAFALADAAPGVSAGPVIERMDAAGRSV